MQAIQKKSDPDSCPGTHRQQGGNWGGEGGSGKIWKRLPFWKITSPQLLPNHYHSVFSNQTSKLIILWKYSMHSLNGGNKEFKRDICCPWLFVFVKDAIKEWTLSVSRNCSRVGLVVQELLSRYLSAPFFCKMSLRKHISTSDENIIMYQLPEFILIKYQKFPSESDFP